MSSQSEANKAAWSYKAYDFWTEELGEPLKLAESMVKDPNMYLRRHLEYLGEVKEKKIINLLGSCGKKAIPLALMGANVTIVDISEQNKAYAMEVAQAAGVHINYIIADFGELDITPIKNSFHVAYLEGGILHYFHDLDVFSKKLFELLQVGGKLVLNDFHPIRKIFKSRDIFDNAEDSLELSGDYFEDKIQVGAVAHEKYFTENEKKKFPKCLLRYWTMGEIITALATAGFVIEKLVEGPRFDSHTNIPGEFTIVATKYKIEK